MCELVEILDACRPRSSCRGCARARSPTRRWRAIPRCAAPSAIRALSILILSNGNARRLRERAVAGAEIVQHDANAELAQLMQHGERVLALVQQDGLGDLELQTIAAAGPTAPAPAARFRSGCASGTAAAETLMATLQGSGQRAAWAQACSRVHSPTSAHQPHLLGDGDALVGRNRAALGMIPAQQRFEARPPAAT